VAGRIQRLVAVLKELVRSSPREHAIKKKGPCHLLSVKRRALGKPVFDLQDRGFTLSRFSHRSGGNIKQNARNWDLSLYLEVREYVSCLARKAEPLAEARF